MTGRLKEAEDLSATPAVTKSGRVRKKSAKVLEMEEAEQMEKSLSKKVQDTVKGLRETLGGMTVLAKKTPTKATMSIPSLQKSVSTSSGSMISAPAPGTGSFLEGDGEPVDSLPQPQSGAVKTIFPDTTPVPPAPKQKAEKSAKKSKSKKGKDTTTPALLSQPAFLGDSPLQINVSNSALSAGDNVQLETTPPLKLKLVLSPTKEASLCDTMDVIPPSSYDMELDDDGGVLQIAEPTPVPRKKLKKKKKRKRESEGSTGLKTLLLGEAAASKKWKKSSKKQMTMSQSTDEEEFMATMNAFGQEHTEVEDGLNMKLPVYANTSEMALKLKTSAERKASKQRKYKKGKTKEDPLKPRKRRAPTAYMLWCASYRQKVITETPGIDFVQMSKRLGELWQALPEKQKMGWKRKARKAATKGTTMISTGKSGLKSGHVGTLLQSGQHQVKGSVSKRAAIHTEGTGHSTTSQSDQEHKMSSFMVGCQPIDAAAHLKLLGESLSVIGARLKEHVGPGTVQGSVSVLLDSLICALGPLMCLTKQVKELDGCSKETLVHTLDNIAYVMPGIG